MPLNSRRTFSGPEMTHRDEHAAVRTRVAFQDLVHDGAADDVARRPLAARIVIEHEALARRRRAASRPNRASPLRAPCRSCACHRLRAVRSDGTAPFPCRAEEARRAAPSPCRRTTCRPTAYDICTSSGRRRWRATCFARARAAARPNACRASARPPIPIHRPPGRGRAPGDPRAAARRGARPAPPGGS